MDTSPSALIARMRCSPMETALCGTCQIRARARDQIRARARCQMRVWTRSPKGGPACRSRARVCVSARRPSMPHSTL
eukprot:2624602-Prymnesium_polylepis.1